jgi:DNA ligase 4
MSTTELDIKLDQGQQPQSAELFKYPFVVELVGASFDKPAKTMYFALRFPFHINKIQAIVSCPNSKLI